MYYDKIWSEMFDKQFEYFMKKIITVPLSFLMKNLLNMVAVIDLKILDFFQKYGMTYLLSPRFKLISVNNFYRFFAHGGGVVLRKFILVG